MEIPNHAKNEGQIQQSKLFLLTGDQLFPSGESTSSIEQPVNFLGEIFTDKLLNSPVANIFQPVENLLPKWNDGFGE
jgi:hypothetical protein